MRKLVLILAILTIVLPALAAKRVTLSEFEQILAAHHRKPDADVAALITQLELTERPSDAWRKRMDAELPGVAARDSLVALADKADFLNPPATEIPTLAPPNRAASDALVAAAKDYVSQTIPKLPNFLATRVTTRFEDMPAMDTGLYYPAKTSYEPLHVVNIYRVVVLNRDGQELVDPGDSFGKMPGSRESGLKTSGEFGPVLIALMADVFEGDVLWSRWEAGATGSLAVLHFSVPWQRSHLGLRLPALWKNLQTPPAYHGEMNIDPASGAILRVTIEAEMTPDDPVTRAALMVEYGPVEIGGKTFICPIRSVALSKTRIIKMQHGKVNHRGWDDPNHGPQQTELNDVQFLHYHQFRAETRIVTEGVQPTEVTPPASLPAKIPPAPQATPPGR
jgi:hypothetical protein